MIIAIIGSTGLVGSEIIKIIEEKKIKNLKSVLFISSKKSVGKRIKYKNKFQKIISIKKAIKKKPNYALFSAGSKIALKYAKEFTNKGTVVIDNSSAFRMNKNIKLIVPEINGDTISKKDKIISNPNCSTTQLVMALYPIHKKSPIKRIVVSTYQAVTGTGLLAVKQLENEEQHRVGFKKVYKDSIYRNVIPKCDEFNQDGYTKEEQKIINETNKILNSNIQITATAVRTPTIGGHGESVNIEFKKQTKIKEIISLLKKQKGVIVQQNQKYKTPKDVCGKNQVFVSRIRKDNSVKNGINMWIVADPLRKGAATNAIQILELLINKYR